MMTRLLPSRWAAFALLSGLIAAGGCGEAMDEAAGGKPAEAPPVAATEPPPEPEPEPVPVPVPEEPEEYRSSPEVVEIMHKLNAESDSLTPLIGEELKDPAPPWATIQEQAAEFKRLAGELSKYEPQRGTQKSWSEQTAAYAKLAGDLDEAARAQKKDEALAAQRALEVACTPCHREHRVIRPGASPVGGGGGGGRRRRGEAPPERPAPTGPADSEVPMPAGGAA